MSLVNAVVVVLVVLVIILTYLIVKGSKERKRLADNCVKYFKKYKM